MPIVNYPVLVTDAPLGEEPKVYAAIYDGTSWKNIEYTNSYNEYGDLYNVTHWRLYPPPAPRPSPPGSWRAAAGILSLSDETPTP